MRHIIHKSWHKDKAATDILKTKMLWVVYTNVCILLNQSQTTSKFQKIINLPSPQSFLFDLVLLGHHVVPRKVNLNKIRKCSWQDHDNQRLIKHKFMFSKSHLTRYIRGQQTITVVIHQKRVYWDRHQNKLYHHAKMVLTGFPGGPTGPGAPVGPGSPCWQNDIISSQNIRMLPLKNSQSVTM